MPVAPAATVLLVRRENPGFSVFLVKRHGRSAFMPDIWVFPGGRVEAADGMVPSPLVRGGHAAAARLGLDASLARALLAAGVRETFEEAGIWLGDGAVPDPVRGALARGEAALGEVLAQHRTTLDLDVLRPWARWVTPEGETRRFDTVFLLAVTDGCEGRHDASETVDSGWFRPADVLASGLARMGLAPPTWWTLTELSRLDSVEAVLAAAERRSLSPVRPVLSPGPHGFGIALPGHPEHPEPAREDVPRRIGLGAKGEWTAE